MDLLKSEINALYRRLFRCLWSNRTEVKRERARDNVYTALSLLCGIGYNESGNELFFTRHVSNADDATETARGAQTDCSYRRLFKNRGFFFQIRSFISVFNVSSVKPLTSCYHGRFNESQWWTERPHFHLHPELIIRIRIRKTALKWRVLITWPQKL